MTRHNRTVSNERKRGARPSEARQAFDGVGKQPGGQNRGVGV